MLQETVAICSVHMLNKLNTILSELFQVNDDDFVAKGFEHRSGHSLATA